MKITDLNQDALRAIAFNVREKVDLLSLMLSCKSFCEAGTPAILRNVELDGEEQVSTFCVSVLRERSLGRFTHTLTVSGEWLPEEPDSSDDSDEEGESDDENGREAVCRPLAEVILAMPNLRKVDIAIAETALCWCPSLLNALAECSQLVSLRLEEYSGGDYDGLSRGTRDLMKKLHAPLRKVELVPLVGERFPHPLELLLNFTSTLEEVIISILDINTGKYSSVQWPHVHTLVLDYARVHTAVLEHAFPAVRELKVELEIESEWATDPPEHYIANLAHVCSVWKRIPHLRGDVGGLWTLALSGVEAGLLDVDDVLYKPYQAPALADVVSRVQPEMLSITVCSSDGFLALLGQADRRLRVLDIDLVRLWNQDTQGGALEYIVSSPSHFFDFS